MRITDKFESYIQRFIREHELFNSNGLNLLAVSGGVDSMALLALYHRIYRGKFEVLHFNHGTRDANIIDQNLVEEFCLKHSIPFHLVQFSFDLNISNFENRARIERKKIYETFIRRGYYVVTAHHLDDSFEWHLMQKFKQSQLKSSLGIPVYNKGIVRPFLSVSKKQIYHYARENNLAWNEDESNTNNRFERNNLRNIIIPKIQMRYPNYLKHYAEQSNRIARVLGLHRQSIVFPLKKFRHHLTGVVLNSSRFEIHKEKIAHEIQKLSAKKRGELRQQIDKIVASQRIYQQDPTKIKFYGPYLLSGGVEAILYKDCLYLYHQSQKYKLDEYDRLNSNNAQIPFEGDFETDLSFFPNLMRNRTPKDKKSKLVYPFLVKTIERLKKSDIPYNYFV